MEKALEGMEAELGSELHSQLAPAEQQEVRKKTFTGLFT